MRFITTLANSALSILCLAGFTSCIENTNSCALDPGVCAISVDTTIAHLDQDWNGKISFSSSGLDTSKLSAFQMEMTQNANRIPITISSTGSPNQWTASSTSKLFMDNHFQVGSACLNIDMGYDERKDFFSTQIIITDKLTFSNKTVYTDADALNMNGQFPWPVWAGVLPDPMAGKAGQVMIWNDGKNNGVSERRIKTINSTYTGTNDQGISNNSKVAVTGSPHLEAVPAVGIARRKILVAYPYNAGTSSLTVIECDPTATVFTDSLLCRTPMGTNPNDTDLIPPSIGMYFGTLGNSTLLAYVTQTTPTLKTSTFDSSTSNLSDTKPAAMRTAPTGSWSHVSFGMGSLTAKSSQELLVYYHGTNPALSIYTLGGKGELLDLTNQTISADLLKQISSVTAITVGDLDNDGLADIATAQTAGSKNTITIYLNQGNGKFNVETGDLADITSASSITSLAIGNVNADAKADIVATVAADKQVFVYLNTTPDRPLPTPCP